MSDQDLAATLNAVNDPITVQQPDGRLVWANEAAAQLLGFSSPEELITASPKSVMDRLIVCDEKGDPIAPQDLPGPKALAGEQPPEVLLQWKVFGADEMRWSVVRSRPVFDEHGNVRFAVNVIRDDTVRQVAIRSLQQSEERVAFLASASRALLGASLDPTEIAERLTDVCVPRMGDLCAVWLTDPDGDLQLLATRVDSATITTAPQFEKPPNEVMNAAAGVPVLKSRSDEVDASSAVAVPIPGRNGPLGAIFLVRQASRHALSPGDLQLVQEVGRRAGVAIENALLYAERSRAAEILSRSLLPSELPDVPGLDLYAFVRPAASGMGGDFYDVVSLADGRSLLVIADVSGKGPEAAALTAMARYTLRTLSTYYASPAELLRAVNEALVDQLPEGRFCTLACGAFGPSPDGVRVTVAVAGHPKPILLRSSGAVESCGATGLPLGVFYRLDLHEQDVILEPEDSFLLITDGCIGEGSVWEPELHAALSAAAPQSAEQLARLVEGVALGVQPDHPDDIAALVAHLPQLS